MTKPAPPRFPTIAGLELDRVIGGASWSYAAPKDSLASLVESRSVSEAWSMTRAPLAMPGVAPVISSTMGSSLGLGGHGGWAALAHEACGADAEVAQAPAWALGDEAPALAAASPFTGGEAEAAVFDLAAYFPEVDAPLHLDADDPAFAPVQGQAPGADDEGGADDFDADLELASIAAFASDGSPAKVDFGVPRLSPDADTLLIE
jgi:hypothetical protein